MIDPYSRLGPRERAYAAYRTLKALGRSIEHARELTDEEVVAGIMLETIKL